MPAQKRVMLQGYEQQLLAARRLARFRVRRRLAEGESPEDPDPAIKRREFVQKVARELHDMLIYTGSENPIMEEIRSELSRSLGYEVRFTYPPGEKLRIVRVMPNGTITLTEKENQNIIANLMPLILNKVSGSMLNKA